MCRCAPELLRAHEQRAHPARGVLAADLGRLRAQQRGERRDLHRQVHARERPERVALEHRALGPARRRLGERVERLEAARRVAVGLGLGDGGLAEQVERDGGAVLPEVADRARAPRAGVSPTMKRCAMWRTPAAAAAPSAARPGLRARHPHRRLDRRRPLVHLLEVAGRGGARGRRASGRPGSRPRSGTARRAARWSCEASSIACWSSARSGCAARAGKARVDRAAHLAGAQPPRAESTPRARDSAGYVRPCRSSCSDPCSRYVGETEAVIWVETDGPARSRCSARASAPSASAATTTRSSAPAGSSPAPGTSTRSTLDGERVWPRRTRLPASAFRTYPKDGPLQVVFGSCRVAAPHEPPYSLRKDEDPRGREIDALPHAGRCACATSRASEWPDVLADARRPGLRRRGLARHRSPSSRRRRDPSEPPGERVLDFEEYTQLYHESWSRPDDPLAALDGLDGDDLRRPRRPRRLEHLRRPGSRRCAARVVERAHRRRR